MLDEEVLGHAVLPQVEDVDRRTVARVGIEDEARRPPQGAVHGHLTNVFSALVKHLHEKTPTFKHCSCLD